MHLVTILILIMIFNRLIPPFWGEMLPSGLQNLGIGGIPPPKKNPHV
jgi:hypothetical protein